MLKFVCVLICLCSYWVGSVEVLDCQCWWFCAWLEELSQHSSWPVTEGRISVWCENSQRGGKKSSTDFQGGHSGKKKKKKPKYVGGEQERRASF